MGITERRLRQKEAVRNLIIEAAWKIIKEEGWSALSIRKLADAIEYSVPVIYDHFVNKEALQLEFIKIGFQLLNGSLKSAKERSSDPEGQIREIGSAFLGFASQNKEYYQLMFGLGIPTCETINTVPEIHSFTEIILDPLRALMRSSKNNTPDPLLKLQTFWCMLLGIVAMENFSNPENELEKMKTRVLEDFISSFIKGIKD